MSSSSRYHHGDLHRATLDAAVDVIASEGVHALSLRKLAKSLGVTHAALSYHFKDRGRLLVAVAEEGFEALSASLKASHEDAAAADEGERLMQLGLAYINFARSHPGHFRVMFGREIIEYTRTSTKLQQAGNEAFDVLASAFPSGKLGDDVLLAWALAHGIAELYLHGPLRTRAQENTEQLEQWIEGALRRGAAAAALART